MPIVIFWPFGAVLVFVGAYLANKGLNHFPTDSLMVAGGTAIAMIFGVMTAISYLAFFRTTAQHPKLGKMAPLLYTLLFAFIGARSLLPMLR